MIDKIKLTTNESGDYAILECGDFKREGHCITGWNWMDLLKHLGYEIEFKENSHKVINIHKQQFDSIEKDEDYIILSCIEDGRCICFEQMKEENEDRSKPIILN